MFDLSIVRSPGYLSGIVIGSGPKEWYWQLFRPIYFDVLRVRSYMLRPKYILCGCMDP